MSTLAQCHDNMVYNVYSGLQNIGLKLGDKSTDWSVPCGFVFEGAIRYTCRRGRRSVRSTCALTQSYLVYMVILGFGLVVLAVAYTKAGFIGFPVLIGCWVALFDIYTDAALLLDLSTSGFETYFYAFAITLAASMLSNIVIIYYVIIGEISNTRFCVWYAENTGFIRYTYMLSSFDISFFFIINSKAFGIDLTDSGMSRLGIRRLNTLLCVALLIENIPQLVLQAILFLNFPIDPVSTTNPLAKNVRIAIVISVLDIMSALLGLIMATTDDDCDMDDEERYSGQPTLRQFTGARLMGSRPDSTFEVESFVVS